MKNNTIRAFIIMCFIMHGNNSFGMFPGGWSGDNMSPNSQFQSNDFSYLDVSLLSLPDLQTTQNAYYQNDDDIPCAEHCLWLYHVQQNLDQQNQQYQQDQVDNTDFVLTDQTDELDQVSEKDRAYKKEWYRKNGVASNIRRAQRYANFKQEHAQYILEGGRLSYCEWYDKYKKRGVRLK